jgi:hypothetical protein
VFVRCGEAIARQLAARTDVDLAYWSSPVSLDEGGEASLAALSAFNEWASRTARTDAVHRRGVNGAGVKVLINDTAPVATTNPFLPPIVAGNSSTAAAHATAVAGIVASRHAPHTGAAPGLAQLYSYGAAGDTTAPQAWAWGMQQGISFGNCTWWNGQKGQIQFLDRYFDYIIRTFAVMLFKSAGNQGTGDGKVTTPGCGYNMTASGNATDNNEWRPARVPERLGGMREHAGVLSTQAWLDSFPTTPTNRNRHRVNVMAWQFLATDVTALAARPIEDGRTFIVPTVENLEGWKVC